MKERTEEGVGVEQQWVYENSLYFSLHFDMNLTLRKYSMLKIDTHISLYNSMYICIYVHISVRLRRFRE